MSIKCLYLGVWKDGTGWGNAAQNYILALDKAGVDVVPRAVTLANARDDVYIPERILELEQNDESGCDVCIQHLLPNFMERGNFDLNIGMFAAETSHFRNSDWATYLNMMDQVWVFNSNMVKMCHNSFVDVPITVIPHTFDLSKYGQRYEPYPIEETNGKFVFYTMAEITRRKNIAGLLKAFHLTFAPHEDVAMLICGSVPGVSASESNKIIRNMINEIKSSMRLYPSNDIYHNEIIVTQWLTDNEVMRIHKTGDCFVLPSRGEAWCIPGFEAMALGNPVILSDCGGPGDYITDYENGLLLDTHEEPVFMRGEEVQTDGIWQSNESWYESSICELSNKMREIFQNENLRKNLAINGIDKAYEYSHEQIGRLMKNAIVQQSTLQGFTIPLEKKHNISRLIKG